MIAAYLCVANEWSGRQSRQGFPEHELSLHQPVPCTIGELQLISSTSDIVKILSAIFEIPLQTGGRGEARRRVFANFRGESFDNKTLDLQYQDCLLDSMCVTSIYKNRTDFVRAVNSYSLCRTDRKRSESIKNRIYVT